MVAKRVPAVFFASPGGAEPVREWLLSLPINARKKIGDAIADVEFGWPVGMPICRSLGKGLYEVRASLKDRIARVIFAIESGEMVLLHGFIKKSQAAPTSDLDLARRRLREYLRSDG